MRHDNSSSTMILSAMLILGMAGAVHALVVVPPPSLPERVAAAEVIVVGRVVSLEDKDVVALPFAQSAKKVAYCVAIVKITEKLKGVKDEQTLRIGFLAPPEVKGGGIRPKPRFGTTLAVGQECLFFLKKHFQQTFFVIPMYYDEVSAKQPNYAKDLELTRYAMKFGEDLAAGLEAKDAKDRYYAATLLLYRYRSYRSAVLKTEPIDAKESQRILTVLREADWKQQEPIAPWSLFLMLGLTKKDGWQLPAKASAEAYHQAAQDWLREHAGTFRIQRFVGKEK